MTRTRRARLGILVTLATLIAIAAGIAVITTVVPRDILALLVSCTWGGTIAIIGLGYYETRVK